MDKDTLTRIAEALERLSPPAPAFTLPDGGDRFVWEAREARLRPAARDDALPLDVLVGIDRAKELLLQNSRQFAAGHPANNTLLWGARGMGKSSLVKSVHAVVKAEYPLSLVEIHREDLETLPALLSVLRRSPQRFILLCDDLSFDAGETSYKSLKSVLEGGLDGRPENVLFYATSNRRHLLPREATENEQSSALNPGDVIEEKLSLSDRFGLWVGFYSASEQEFQDMVAGYARLLEIDMDAEALHAAAVEWSRTRGARSGRVAWQLAQDLKGRTGLEKA